MVLSERSGDSPEEVTASPIYEEPQAAASADRSAKVRAGIEGAVAAIAFWLVFSELGFPRIAGIGRLSVLPIAIVGGVLIGMTRFRRALVTVTAALTLFLLLLAFTPLMRGPTKRLVRIDPVPQTADAIVILSAGVTPDGMLPQQGLDRLLKGVELARRGAAPSIVLTREEKRIGRRAVTTQLDQQRIAAFANTKVILTQKVASTRDEAVQMKAIATREGWTRIILVTSPFHSRRACATFEKAGLTVSCVPSDSRDIAIRTLGGPEDRVRAFGMWTYELAGTLRYWFSGWI